MGVPEAPTSIRYTSSLPGGLHRSPTLLPIYISSYMQGSAATRFPHKVGADGK